MNAATVIVLAVVAALTALALRSIFKSKKNSGGCCAGCSRAGGDCSYCRTEQDKQ